MSDDIATSVDQYIAGFLLPEDPVLEQTLAAMAAAEMPSISVSPAQGKMLMLLAQVQGARSILEIGTLGGYSSIWLGRGLPDNGRLITLELEPNYAEIARKNITRAGLEKKIEVRVGPALETLPKLRSKDGVPFDMIFIDADKATYPDYFRWALKLSRSGTVIIIDNLVRKGAIIDPADNDPHVAGMRQCYELLAKETRVEATVIQTVGSKGHDGFALVRVK